ncbi:MAG: RING finger domain-containing protein [bacterium]
MNRFCCCIGVCIITFFTLYAAKKEHVEKESCSICLDELDERTIFISPCRHGFHIDCLRDWITKGQAKSTEKCPLCRQNYKELIYLRGTCEDQIKIVSRYLFKLLLCKPIVYE